MRHALLDDSAQCFGPRKNQKEICVVDDRAKLSREFVSQRVCNDVRDAFNHHRRVSRVQLRARERKTRTVAHAKTDDKSTS